MSIQVLTLFEEESYSEDDLLRKLFECGVGSPTKALEELLHAEVQTFEPDEPSAENFNNGDAVDEKSPLRLFSERSMRAGHTLHKVHALVGSGRLPESDLVFEILPKVTFPNSNSIDVRRSLSIMWSRAFDLAKYEHAERAYVDEVDVPLHEWLVRRLLDQVQQLLRQGIRLNYVEREENLETLRGRMLPLPNLRVNAFAPHRFFCRFAELSLDRPENRLIRSALGVVANRSASLGHRRAARQLVERLRGVPLSRNVRKDLAAWRSDRLMAHYREIRMTCSWILMRRGIAPAVGMRSVVGCFVRMNMVFERYVVRWFAEELKSHGIELVGQGAGDHRSVKHLVSTFRNGIPQTENLMRPDMLVYRAQASGRQLQCLAVMDAKWKRWDRNSPISREDAYQIYAYARHWLADRGLVVLIYPNTCEAAELQRFAFNELSGISIVALPFRLPVLANSDSKILEGCGDELIIELRRLGPEI